MLAAWVEMLPLFVVRWLALRHCERLKDGSGKTLVTARKDVLIVMDEKK
jgi:hypothetical protein